MTLDWSTKGPNISWHEAFFNVKKISRSKVIKVVRLVKWTPLVKHQNCDSMSPDYFLGLSENH